MPWPANSTEVPPAPVTTGSGSSATYICFSQKPKSSEQEFSSLPFFSPGYGAMMQIGTNLGRHAVIRFSKLAPGASAAAAFIFSAIAAQAQLAPPAPKATPAVPPAAPAAKATPATPAAPAAPAKAAPAKKAAAASACKGLDEKACVARGAACDWVVPKVANSKTGKVQSAYCRVNRPPPKGAPKKADAGAAKSAAPGAAPASPKAAPAAPAKAPAAATK